MKLPEKYWSIIEDYLPDYSSSSDVLFSDILSRYLHDELDEEDNASDFDWIKSEVGSLDKNDVRVFALKWDTELYEKALEVKNGFAEEI